MTCQDIIINAVESVLANHPHAWFDDCTFHEETETHEINVSGIEEGEEYYACEAAENALKACGFRIIAGEPDRQIGKFWLIVEKI